VHTWQCSVTTGAIRVRRTGSQETGKYWMVTRLCLNLPGIGIGVVPVDNPAMTVESWVKRKSACECTTENNRGDEKSGKHTVGSVWRVREGWGRWDPGIGYWVQS
jgi:hypothetical protein